MPVPFGLPSGVLPAHPRLKPDELFSSWFVRTALANRMKVYRLVLNLLGDRYAEFVNLDIDRSVNQLDIEALADATSTPVQEIQDTQLHDLLCLLNDTDNVVGNVPWLLPFGFRSRVHHQAGVQFCPICLKTDPQPYFRRSWRLAYSTECELHDILLEDRCPHCQGAINYFHIDTATLAHPFSQGLDKCHRCGRRLSEAMPTRDWWPDYSHALAIKAIALSQGLDWMFIGDRVFRPAGSLMIVLRMLIAAMSSRDPRGELYDYVAKIVWPEGYRSLSLRGLSFEFRPVTERRRLFGMAVWLMMDWPHRLQTSCFDLKLSDGQLTQYARNMPRWFYFERRAYVAPWYLTSRRFKLS
jgi:TniQ